MDVVYVGLRQPDAIRIACVEPEGSGWRTLWQLSSSAWSDWNDARDVAVNAIVTDYALRVGVDEGGMEDRLSNTKGQLSLGTVDYDAWVLSTTNVRNWELGLIEGPSLPVTEVSPGAALARLAPDDKGPIGRGVVLDMPGLHVRVMGDRRLRLLGRREPLQARQSDQLIGPIRDAAHAAFVATSLRKLQEKVTRKLQELVTPRVESAPGSANGRGGPPRAETPKVDEATDRRSNHALARLIRPSRTPSLPERTADPRRDLETKELEGLQSSFSHMVQLVLPDVLDGRFSVIIGDDTSGRVPALLVRHAINQHLRAIGQEPLPIMFWRNYSAQSGEFLECLRETANLA